MNNRKSKMQRLNKFLKLEPNYLRTIENKIIEPENNIYHPKVGEIINVSYTQNSITNTVECTVIGYNGKQQRKFIILLSKHNVVLKIPLFVKQLNLNIVTTKKHISTKVKRAKLYYLTKK